jgi:DNA-binding transcriptional LysR family regulator
MGGTIRQLEVFGAVCRLGSHAAAAQALGISQVAISRHIGALERASGRALFDRIPGLPGRLNDAGRQLLRESETMLSSVRRLGFAGSGADLPITVRVGAGGVILNTMFRPAALNLQIEGRRIELDFHTLEPCDVPPDVLTRDNLDLAYMALPEFYPVAEHAQPLARYRGALFASPRVVAAWRADRSQPFPVVLPLAGSPLEQAMRMTLARARLPHYRIAAHVVHEHAMELAYAHVGGVLISTTRAQPGVEAGLLEEVTDLGVGHDMISYGFLPPRPSAAVMLTHNKLMQFIEKLS